MVAKNSVARKAADDPVVQPALLLWRLIAESATQTGRASAQHDDGDDDDDDENKDKKAHSSHFASWFFFFPFFSFSFFYIYLFHSNNQ